MSKSEEGTSWFADKNTHHNLKINVANAQALC